jgi:hypothetical protein
MPFDQTESRSLKLRQKLDHPVVDGDGHTQEYHPVLLDYLKEIGGSDLVTRYKEQRFGGSSWQKQSPEERFDKQTRRPPFWTMPSKNTLDCSGPGSTKWASILPWSIRRNFSLPTAATKKSGGPVAGPSTP